MMNGERDKWPGGIVVGLLGAGFFCMSILWAAPSFSTGHMNLTLKRAIETVAEKNLAIQAEGFTIRALEASVLSEEGKFDPSLDLEVTSSHKQQESATRLTAGDDRTFNTDIRFTLPTEVGYTLELDWSDERTDSDLEFLLVNPSHQSRFTLTLTHPILKNFGQEVQTSRRTIAENNLEISRLKFNETIGEVVLEALKAYWELFFARADLEVSNKSLELAKSLLKEVQGRIMAGKLASLEIFKAQAEVAVREGNLNRAIKAVSDSEDSLRALMNVEDWEIEIIPIDPPPTPRKAPALEAGMETAILNRWDFKQASLDIANRGISRKYFENQRKPELNLTAVVDMSGEDQEHVAAAQEVFSGDNQSWALGLSFSMPLGNRGAEGDYLKARYEEQRALSVFGALRQKIKVEVRNALRGLVLARESIDSTTRTRIAAEKRLQAEEERFRVGKATLNDVLEFQAEYAKALSGEKRGEADYAIALGEMEKAMGTLAGAAPF